MIKFILKILFLISILGILGASFLFFQYKSLLNSSLSDNPEKKVFEIKKGLSADQVLAKLRNEGIISSQKELALKIYIRYEEVPAFKEGTYKIPLNLETKDLIGFLENPELTDIWVTIPEGLRKDEIAKIFANEYEGVTGAVFSEPEFLKLTTDYEYIYSLGLEGVKNLEGYLFPDRYLMPSQATTDYIIRTLVRTFKEKAGDVSYKQVIIASMLEREGLSDSDRPLISDVISKRLEEGWLLQIDATLLYYYKDWKHVITQQDKEKDQPYNTYFKIGLPPTPICNPGLSSILAAKNPKPNPYYYYIHAQNGNVYFAKTLAEHETNISKYLRY